MNSAQLIAYFDRITEAPEAISRLRAFILGLAVGGRLVEQDPNDEPATELLKRIEIEKARLAKTRESGKEAVVSEIKDNSLPFHVPRGWQWARLAFISNRIHYGFTTSANSAIESVRLLRITDIQDNSVNWSSVPGCEISQPEVEQYKLQRGDILIARTGGTIGKTFLVTDVPVIAVFASYLIRVQAASALYDRYLKLFLESPLYWKQLQDGARGTGQPNVNGQTLGRIAVTIPPIGEQHRIVAKVDELMALCDRFEVSQAERENRRNTLVAASLHYLNDGANAESFREPAHFYLNHLSRFTGRTEHIKRLRQTILNLAVRGRLVPQDHRDEPASELLTRIQAEKARLVKESKRKTDAILHPIDYAQKPFELPSGWSWARFPELGLFGRGKSKHRPRNDQSLFEGGTHLLVQTGDVARSNGVIKTYTNKYNDVGLAQSAKWPAGTLCITIAANIADSGILSFDACFPDSVVGFIPSAVFPNGRYFEYFLRTAKGNLLEFAPATAQKNINLEILNAVLIPLPPLSEQQRIVAKVDELMSLCDKLEAQLTSAQTDSRRLLESVLHHTLMGSCEAD
jgi:type I restriction enzyme, S subunit